MSAFPSVRPATAADLPEILGLYELAATHFRDRRGGTVYLARSDRHQRIRDDLEYDLSSPDRVVLVGTIHDTILGFVTFGLHGVSGDDDASIASIEELFVQESARGVGLGAALMDAAVHWAQEHGCIGIDATVLPGDRETKNFFESFGLIARTIIVHRPLNASDDDG